VGAFKHASRWLWALILPFVVEVLHHVCADLLIEWSRAEVKQPGWHKMVAVMASAFARSYPLVVSGALTLLIVTFVLVMARREDRIEAASARIQIDHDPRGGELVILRILVSGLGDHSARTIAGMLSINPQKAQYYIDNLLASGHATRNVLGMLGSDTAYTVTPKGRATLVRLGLL